MLKRPMSLGMMPRPLDEGDSRDERKRTCMPMQMPKYGFPDAMYSRRGSKRPRDTKPSMALPNAPTPGKMRL